MLNRRWFVRSGTMCAVAARLPAASATQASSAPTKIMSLDQADHYTWGGTTGTDCDAWHFVRSTELSVIEERMPNGTQETPHFHTKARQFFFVLEGELTLKIDHKDYVLRQGQGIEIGPRIVHQAINRSGASTRFLLTSQPPSHDDRIEAPVTS